MLGTSRRNPVFFGVGVYNLGQQYQRETDTDAGSATARRQYQDLASNSIKSRELVNQTLVRDSAHRRRKKERRRLVKERGTITSAVQEGETGEQRRDPKISRENTAGIFW